MLLKLQHTDVAVSRARAAFIRGGSALAWLKEIDRWGIAVKDLECYILPVSINDISPAGLFVIFKNIDAAQQRDFFEPYTMINENVYTPFHTSLTPAVTPAELKKILLWERQVFHPAIGLIGFDKKDQLDLAELISDSKPIIKDWSFAHPGLLPKETLRQILVTQPSVQEIIESVKQTVDSKPLEEIPKKKGDGSSFPEKIFDKIKWLFFGILLLIVGILRKLFGLIPESSSRPSSGSGKPGPVQRLVQWMEKNLEELEKKRKGELKRLLSLFEENTDEALQYAIPLDSHYLNRGTAPPSSTLSRKPLLFNLGNLGGGGLVDTWDVSDHYHDLRRNYLNAAQKEVEKKNFKKAAYIYAHLLGDYYSAANVLEQGKYFREAATLHKDHLKNIPAAAECLERGGLYLEAIELYKGLSRPEKTGDLYTSLSRAEDALPYYEQAVDAHLANQDYIEAARVINDKQGNNEKARQTLLNGWTDSYKAEPCLKKYFDILPVSDEEKIEEEVREIYTKHTSANKKMQFLNVLEYLNQQRKDEELLHSSQTIAFEIISEQTAKGNTHSVYSLPRFFPSDKLISSDCSRYTNSSKQQTNQTAIAPLSQLDPGIKWIKATVHRNQFLAAGIKDSWLHMARGNWHGNIEYYSWVNPVRPNTPVHFINSPYYSNHIILHLNNELPITRKNLPKNKYFTDSLVVNCPIWLHRKKTQFFINEQEEVCELDATGGAMTLHFYSMDGDLKRSLNCRFEEGANVVNSIYSNPFLLQHGNYFYGYEGKDIVIIDDMGLAKCFRLDSVIRNVAGSGLFADFRLVVSTNKGCLICKPSNGKLNIQGDVFASHLIPVSVTFITTDRFVLTEKKKTTVFQIRNELPEVLQEFETDYTIVAVLPTTSRDRFALLEETGRLTYCPINE